MNLSTYESTCRELGIDRGAFEPDRMFTGDLLIEGLKRETMVDYTASEKVTPPPILEDLSRLNPIPPSKKRRLTKQEIIRRCREDIREAYEMIFARGESVPTLARKAGLSECSFFKVMKKLPTSPATIQRVGKVLTKQERKALGWKW